MVWFFVSMQELEVMGVENWSFIVRTLAEEWMWIC